MSARSTIRKGRMLAGDVAAALGIGVQTLHYYEREGLIPPPARTDSGYRVYTEALVDRVRFIRKAQSLGLPLEEVKEILRLTMVGASPCARVHAALTGKLREVNERLRELESFRDDLAALVAQAPGVRDTSVFPHGCAIVEEAIPLRRASVTAPRLKARKIPRSR